MALMKSCNYFRAFYFVANIGEGAITNRKEEIKDLFLYGRSLVMVMKDKIRVLDRSTKTTLSGRKSLGRDSILQNLK